MRGSKKQRSPAGQGGAPLDPVAAVGSLTGCDHEHSETISIAARWLAANLTGAAHPYMRTLRERFGLAAGDAVRAVAQARRIREGRG